MANNSDNEEQRNHIPACAACKHQRKGCRPDCILRRHFPADRANAFKAVRKIFGVKSLKKMMSGLNPDERDEAEKSIYWEAAMWAQDPVRGPYGCFTRVTDELHKYIYKEQQQSLQQNIMINNNGSGSREQGSRGQVNIEGFGFGSGSNGTNQALNQGLHLHGQNHYINSQRHNNSLPDAREESCKKS